MSIWLNNKKIIKSNLKKDKPCHKLGYCPYGCLVEEFPIKMKSNKISCDLFGHDCPMFYHAEDVSEQDKHKLIMEDMKRRKENDNNF